jgi:hypothetical protein
MVSLDDFPNVYCPACRRVQPARYEVLKADAYNNHDSLDIVCSECRSGIASIHADNPKTWWASWARQKLDD